MATKGKQVITNVYLDPDVFSALKKLSEETGAPMAHYLRKGVDNILAEHGRLPGKTKATPRKPK
jgi:hypothetical protein